MIRQLTDNDCIVELQKLMHDAEHELSLTPYFLTDEREQLINLIVCYKSHLKAVAK